ncbi:hypothetical protein L6164_031075 [Bauhinia variegata]|uniref:Uncharacterized protein n=1 Tax=Bauhinia variegata TaxID=167791 RepID=A0ACB9LEP3_BAUVA|nr:hypothetical protein L6164_031075 [Bauhinia variegata]
MEGVGPRLGRASSRYGTPAVFSGPVRKWKKKWVQVSSASVSYHNSQSQSLTNANSNNNNNNNGGSRLFLRRWTPITAPSTTPAGTADNISGEEPPRRKFRYTPISVLEEQKKVEIRKAEYEAATETDKSTARPANVSPEIPGKVNSNKISEIETQDSDMKQWDLDLGLSGSHRNNRPSDVQLKSA